MSTNYGPRNPNWRGGRTIASTGYVLVRVPGHPLADVRGYVYEHRLVGSALVGRILERHEQVHHRDGDKTNNHPSNLVVTPSKAVHQYHHRSPDSRLRVPGEPNPEVLCECGCGTSFRRFDSAGRPRRFVSGHNMFVGSR